MAKKDDTTEVEVVSKDDGLVRMEWRETEFTFPEDRGEWPTRAMQSFAAQRMFDGIELLLGQQQWEKLNELGPTTKDFWDFMSVFAEAAGFNKA